MKDAVTQRVIKFLESKKITPNAVSECLDISQQALSKQLYGDGKGVTLTTIVGLLTTFQDLSAEWLLRGEGDMKKGFPTTDIYVQNNEIERLRDDNSRLLAIIEALSGAKPKEKNAG